MARSALCCALLAAAGAVPGRADTLPVLTEAIRPQPLAEALAAFASQTGLQLVYESTLAHAKASKGSPAGIPRDVALTRLLEGSGLQFEYLNERSVRILAPKAPPPAARASPAARREHAVNDPPSALEEVVVTATAREESIDRVPISIAVWTQTDMEQTGIKDAMGLANLTPGVEFDSYQDYSAGVETNIAIRGINARDGSTVAIYLDDVPIPTDRASTFGRAFPLTFDLDRVEVLRGPQGTLMGEGAEGGALRFITTQPSLTNLNGVTRGEYATTARGAPSYEVGAALGGPLVPDALGFRLSAWSRRDGGYVDRVDPFTGVTVDANSNWMQRDTFSAALSFAPIEAVRITPAFHYQSVKVHDTSAFYTYLSDPPAGELNNGKLLNQPYLDRFDLASLRITASLGPTELVAEGAYLQRWASAFYDTTNISSRHFLNPLGPEFPLSYADAVPDQASLQQRGVSYQLQLASNDPVARVRWLIGAEYVRAHYEEVQDVVTLAVADGATLNGRVMPDRTTQQLASFGRTDVRFGERFTATAGLRVEHASYDSFEVLTGVGIAGGGVAPPQQFEVQGSATPVAPSLAVSYQADDQNLYYATVAKGYRTGGPNVLLGTVCSTQTPASYGPDSVWSLEFGAKNDLLAGRLRTEASVFHMVWRNLQAQIEFPACSFGYTANAGTAASDGFDFGAQAILTDRLNIKLVGAYAHARYTQTVYLDNQIVVNNGDALGALPLVPSPWNVTAAANYVLALRSGSSLSLRALDVFHSRNPGPFTSQNPDALVYAPERGPDPSANRLDLGATISWRNLELSAFVNNVLDSQPTLQRRNHSPGDTLFYATTFRPRTIGVAAQVQF